MYTPFPKDADASKLYLTTLFFIHIHPCTENKGSALPQRDAMGSTPEVMTKLWLNRAGELNKYLASISRSKATSCELEVDVDAEYILNTR